MSKITHLKSQSRKYIHNNNAYKKIDGTLIISKFYTLLIPVKPIYAAYAFNSYATDIALMLFVHVNRQNLEKK